MTTAKQDGKIIDLIRAGKVPKEVARILKFRKVWTVYNALRRYRNRVGAGKYAYLSPSAQC